MGCFDVFTFSYHEICELHLDKTKKMACAMLEINVFGV